MRQLLFGLAALSLSAIPSANSAVAQITMESSSSAEGLAWRGEEEWRLSLADEDGHLRLGFMQTPAGDYLLTGSLTLDDAELGVTGSGRWRDDQLILDLSVSGGVRAVAPDAGKKKLFEGETTPDRLDSAGFAMMRVELEADTLNGVTQQYQTNIVTGNRVQGPVYRAGTVEHITAP
ncbi:hypothetical protein [Henriciella aquimarina]|uniref:hypothetical protein n=1 Tax=Henriciella aquimarina TaxID=545261 RepID=UPI000A036DA9|nr:hypothetical protein [Henriciella aquimarina]